MDMFLCVVDLLLLMSLLLFFVCCSAEKTDIGWSILPSGRSGLRNARQVMGSHELCLCVMHLIGVDVTCVQHCQLLYLLIDLK